MSDNSKKSLIDKLDALFEDLLDTVTKGVQKDGRPITFDTKIEIFKEGVNWAKVKHKIPGADGDDAGGSVPSGRLANIKRKLDR